MIVSRAVRSAVVVSALAAVVQAPQLITAAPAAAGPRCAHVDHTHWHGGTHWHTHHWRWQYGFTYQGVHHEMFYMREHDEWGSKGPCQQANLNVLDADLGIYSPLDELEDPFVEGDAS